MSAELQNPLQAHDSHSGVLTGTVLSIQANYYQVQLDPFQGEADTADLKAVLSPYTTLALDGQAAALTPYPLTTGPLTLLCTRRSRLKKLGHKVMVGDRVEVEEPDWIGGRGAISQVFHRKSELDRPPVANADQIALVFALAEPNLDPYQLSRFLVKAESTHLEVCLCLNKSDLVTTTEREQWCHRLQLWGYTPILVSVQECVGMPELLDRLRCKTTIVAGPSGVGKSSLINRLIPQANLRVGEVSGKLGRGRHTTRHVELFELPGEDC